PTPALPRKRGRGPGLILLAAHLLLPPLAGEGWDGGSVRRETVERGDLMRPAPQPSPASGGGGRLWGEVPAQRSVAPSQSACGAASGAGHSKRLRLPLPAAAPSMRSLTGRAVPNMRQS